MDILFGLEEVHHAELWRLDFRGGVQCRGEIAKLGGDAGAQAKGGRLSISG